MAGESTDGQGALLWDIVEESFDEAEFLWKRWEDSLVSHARDLAGTTFWVEERLAGSLDGVRVGGEAAFEPLIAAALASDEPWRLVVAAHVAATGDSAKARELLSIMIGAAVGERLSLLRRAVEVVPRDDQVESFEGTLARGGLEQKAALLSLRSFRRRAPGRELDEVLRAENPAARAVALEAARRLGAREGLPLVEFGLGESEIAPRNAALESGLVLGSRAAWARCLELVRAQGPGVGRLLLLVAVLGTEKDQDLVLAAFSNESLRRDALFAAGFAGTLRTADACAEALRSGIEVKLAAEALCAITGLSLEAERLVEPEPPSPDEPIPFEQEDLDADLVPAPDDLLPRPKVAEVLSWWDANRARFPSGIRHLGGRPLELRGLQEILERGPMRRRCATALELAIRTQGRYDVSTRAFTTVQRTQMRAFDDILAGRRTP